MNKIELRKTALARRNALTQGQIQIWSNEICNQTISSQGFQKARIVHIYKSFGSEVQTDQIIQKALESSKIVVVPVVLGNQILLHLQIFANTVFTRDPFGIQNPTENYQLFDNQTLGINDLIIVPLVACDMRNNRIGYGKGFYDNFLAKIRSKKIGLAFKCQHVDNFEPDPWDVPLDQIIQNKKPELE